jgi:hypothetical protein
MSPSQFPIQEQADVLLRTEANRKDVGLVDSFTLDPGTIVALVATPITPSSAARRWPASNFGID